jgi:large subunit ribosomal protein L4e
MKIPVKNLENKEIKKIDLPIQFIEVIREDLIKRAVFAVESSLRVPYGADPQAGKKHSTYMSRRRRNYRGSYGAGISRVPRKILNRRGRRMYWVGAFAPGTVGGRRAHPPKSEKIWLKNINKKERRLAIRSALSSTILKEVVEKRGHKVPEGFPFIVDSSAENLSKTKDVKKMLLALGFNEELERITSYKKIRAGKGKIRGRRYKQKTGPLLVVSDKCTLLKAGANIPGIDVVQISDINAKLLAPGAVPGRLTLYTEKSIELLKEKNMFV